MTPRQLQSLRNLGNECEVAADEIERLLADLAAARELERMWYDRYYTLWISAAPHLPLKTRDVYRDWAKEVNANYDAALAGKGAP